jgi:hypothetical protein
VFLVVNVRCDECFYAPSIEARAREENGMFGRHKTNSRVPRSRSNFCDRATRALSAMPFGFRPGAVNLGTESQMFPTDLQIDYRHRMASSPQYRQGWQAAQMARKPSALPKSWPVALIATSCASKSFFPIFNRKLPTHVVLKVVLTSWYARES